MNWRNRQNRGALINQLQKTAHSSYIFAYILAVICNIVLILYRNTMPLRVQLIIPVITVLLLWGAMLQRRKLLRGIAKSRCRTHTVYIIFFYYVVLAAILLFWGGLFHVHRNYDPTVNLEPFLTINSYIKYYQNTGSFVSISNLAGNILILLPLGIFLPVLFRPMRRLPVFVPTAAVVAIGIEFLQWLTKSGAADIDDSILNFIGALIGYALTRIYLAFVARP